MLVFQAPLIRGITSNADPLVVTFGTDVPDALNLSSESFVDFAILIGTDFSPRLKGLGPNRALKLIRSHQTIENVLANIDSRHAPESKEGYLESVTSARGMFTALPPVPDAKELVPLKKFDAKLVNDILVQFHLGGAAYLQTASASKDAPRSLENDYFGASGDGLAGNWGT